MNLFQAVLLVDISQKPDEIPVGYPKGHSGKAPVRPETDGHKSHDPVYTPSMKTGLIRT